MLSCGGDTLQLNVNYYHVLFLIKELKWLLMVYNNRNNPNIKKLIIDKLDSCDASHVYKTRDLLNDFDKIKVFDCRKKALQRSNDLYHVV